MKESLDTSFAQFIEKNVEALRTVASASSSDLGMLWVVLVYIFDFNCLYLYETDDGINFRKTAAFKRDLLDVEPKYEDFASLMKSAFEAGKAKSTQREEALKNKMLFVEAIAAIPLVINNTKKILVICKQLVKSKDEVVGGYIFDVYKLELYLSVIRIFVRVHEQERQLLQSEKLAELGTLTAGITHEINNPLNTIITKLKMLQDYVLDFKQFLIEFKDDNRLLLSKTKRLNADFIIDRLEKSIQLPLEMAERLRSIVMSLKRFAAIDTGEIELVNVNHLLEDALEIVRNKVKHKAVVNKNYDQNLKPIKTSPNRLSQVLVNLLDNAADAIADHGNMRIKTWQDEKETFIRIIDDGTGISKENLQRIFTPYFTTKEGGLGIGLYISQRIINELGGTITVESQLEKGTTFTVRLPL
ncbi:MAG: ATP-binding protein [candidate division KSB1 bacterium]|nr:ATP-binding protein [candidate division KSB1 bacterium]MDZ7366037.1 ATP-binding protein [candidate division KSB1 bacterium]MDZ7404154.1 ATP-binding protein [candidate division KSB1 bacterium]